MEIFRIVIMTSTNVKPRHTMAVTLSASLLSLIHSGSLLATMSSVKLREA